MPQLPPGQTGALLSLLVYAAAAVVVIDVVLFIAWAVRRDDVLAGTAAPVFAPRWSLVDVWFVGQAVVVLVLLLGLPVMMGLGSRALERSMVPLALASLVPQNLLFVLLPAWFITRRYGERLADIGIRLRPRLVHVLVGIGLGLVVMLVGLGSEAGVLLWLRHALGARQFAALQQLNQAIGNQQFIDQALRSPKWFGALLLGAGLLAPLGEEFFFRAFLFNSARRRFGLWAGVVISAVAFGIVHGGPVLALAIVPVGVCLALAYHVTGSLWVPFLMHATNNSLQLILAHYQVIHV